MGFSSPFFYPLFEVLFQVEKRRVKEEDGERRRSHPAVHPWQK